MSCSDSPFAGLPDAALKRRVDVLVREFEQATSPEAVEMVQREAALLRDELIERLRRRGGGDGDGPGVREPLTPRPGGGGASAVAEDS